MLGNWLHKISVCTLVLHLWILTICGSVHDNEASIDHRLELPVLVFDRICMPAQPLCCLVQVDIVMCAVQCPKRSQACTSTANDGNLLSVVVWS